jgi:hypothetical protein
LFCFGVLIGSLCFLVFLDGGQARLAWESLKSRPMASLTDLGAFCWVYVLYLCALILPMMLLGAVADKEIRGMSHGFAQIQQMQRSAIKWSYRLMCGTLTVVAAISFCFVANREMAKRFGFNSILTEWSLNVALSADAGLERALNWFNVPKQQRLPDARLAVFLPENLMLAPDRTLSSSRIRGFHRYESVINARSGQDMVKAYREESARNGREVLIIAGDLKGRDVARFLFDSHPFLKSFLLILGSIPPLANFIPDPRLALSGDWAKLDWAARNLGSKKDSAGVDAGLVLDESFASLDSFSAGASDRSKISGTMLELLQQAQERTWSKLRDLVQRSDYGETWIIPVPDEGRARSLFFSTVLIDKALPSAQSPQSKIYFNAGRAQFITFDEATPCHFVGHSRKVFAPKGIGSDHSTIALWCIDPNGHRLGVFEFSGISATNEWLSRNSVGILQAKQLTYSFGSEASSRTSVSGPPLRSDNVIGNGATDGLSGARDFWTGLAGISGQIVVDPQADQVSNIEEATLESMATIMIQRLRSLSSLQQGVLTRELVDLLRRSD